MNRLDRFRFGQLHKRRMGIFFLVLVVALAVALIILALLGIFGSRSGFVRVKLSSQLSGTSRDGLGINISQMPSVNRIPMSSFEAGESYLSYSVADVSGNYIFLENGSVLPEFSTENESVVSLLSIDDNGSYVERYSGKITGIANTGLGQMTGIPVDDMLGSGHVTGAAMVNDTYAFLTDTGSVILDAAGTPVNCDDREYVSICSTGDTLYLLASDGTVCASSDGRTVSEICTADIGESTVSEAVCVGANVVSLLDDGRMFLIPGGSGECVFVGDGVSRIVSDGSTVLAMTDGGSRISNNGAFFAPVEGAPGTDEVIDVTSNDDGFFFLMNDSVIRYMDHDLAITDIGTYSENLERIFGISSGKVIAISDDGRSFLLDQERMTPIDSGSRSYAFFEGYQDKVIVSDSEGVRTASLLAGLRVEEPVTDTGIMSGDICIVRSGTYSRINGVIWNTAGEDTVVMGTNSDASDLDSSECIYGPGNGLHAVYTDLGLSVDNFSGSTFYRISLSAKQTDLDSDSVSVWLSGDNGTFGDVGFEITDIGGKFREYSFVFAVTDNMLDENENIYLNIAFEGSGMLYIDDIYLGEDSYEGDSIPRLVESAVCESVPSAIRLDYLKIADEGSSQSSFYGTGSDSLQSALTLVSEASSDPWLVIGPYADSDTIDALLGYLCGSVSSRYGALRIDNGTAVPWCRQFDTIYIEIHDDNGVYATDAQKGAYVNYVIDLIRQSEYFTDINDIAVFLDGMVYEGGTVMSAADHHCGGMLMSCEDGDERGYIERCDELYIDRNYNTPRPVSRYSDAGEYISNLSYDASMRPGSSGEFIASLICGESSFVRMTMVDIPLSQRPVDTESEMVFNADGDGESTRIILSTLRSLSGFTTYQGLYLDVLDPLDPVSTFTAEGFSGDCVSLLAEVGDKVYLIVANCTDVQQQFLLEGGNYRLKGTALDRYSSEGGLIYQRSLRSLIMRQTLGGGEFLIIEIE